MYEHDKTNLGILRIQDSDDHLSPEALNFPAIFSVTLVSAPVTWERLSHTAAPGLGASSALELPRVDGASFCWSDKS